MGFDLMGFLAGDGSGTSGAATTYNNDVAKREERNAELADKMVAARMKAIEEHQKNWDKENELFSSIEGVAAKSPKEAYAKLLAHQGYGADMLKKTLGEDYISRISDKEARAYVNEQTAMFRQNSRPSLDLEALDRDRERYVDNARRRDNATLRKLFGVSSEEDSYEVLTTPLKGMRTGQSSVPMGFEKDPNSGEDFTLQTLTHTDGSQELVAVRHKNGKIIGHETVIPKRGMTELRNIPEGANTIVNNLLAQKLKVLDELDLSPEVKEAIKEGAREEEGIVQTYVNSAAMTIMRDSDVSPETAFKYAWDGFVQGLEQTGVKTDPAGLFNWIEDKVIDTESDTVIMQMEVDGQVHTKKVPRHQVGYWLRQGATVK